MLAQFSELATETERSELLLTKGGSVMQKTIPMRQCLGCREMKPKKELIRVVRSPEGEISLDFRGKANGRGAYVCPNADCLKKAIRGRALEKAFSSAIPDEVYDRLREEMERGE